ncbi:hypothetical protein KIPB_006380, partial [Kipferlia bialata]
VETSGRRYAFSVRSEGERESWLDCVRSIILGDDSR